MINIGDSATNNFKLIHDYKTYHRRVSLFSQEKQAKTNFWLQGRGYIRIVFDYGNILNWNVAYVPEYDGTVLFTNNKYYFDQIDHDNGKLIFNKEHQLSLKKNSCGQWMITGENCIVFPSKGQITLG